MYFSDLHIKTSQTYRYSLAKDVLKHDFAKELIDELKSSKAIFLIDENVWDNHKYYLQQSLITFFEHHLIEIIPSGETSKNLTLFSELIEKILAFGVERRTPLFAIGGGVCGDLSGYVASSILRGIPLIHIPTTSLSIVDSSIGGKTGVNSKAGKNLIGAFYQPKAILADTHFLDSLPEREMLCGISETIKHGLISKKELVYSTLDLLQSNFGEAEFLEQILFASASVKMDIVQQDTLERGLRATLNLGHTFGHAIEAAAGYGQFLHGEAVFIGMLAAEYASSVMYSRSLDLWMDDFIPFYRSHMPDKVPSIERLIPYMFKDKKNKNGKIHLILSPKMGIAELKEIADLNLLSASFEYAFDKLDLSTAD